MTRTLQRHIPWPLFILVSVLFGFNYMWAHFSLLSFNAMSVSWWRTILAALTLLVALKITKQRLPRGFQQWFRLNNAALLLNTITFAGTAVSISRLSTVQVSIWNSLVPLVTLMFVIAFIPEEKPTLWRIAGISLGFFGALVIAQPWQGLGQINLVGTAAVLIGTAAYAGGLVYARLFLTDTTSSAMANTAAMMICSAGHFTLFLLASQDFDFVATSQSWIAITVLGTIGTAGTYLLIQKLIERSGASVASDTTYPILISAIIIGVLIVGDPLNVWQITGATLIVLGLVVIETRDKLS